MSIFVINLPVKISLNFHFSVCIRLNNNVRHQNNYANNLSEHMLIIISIWLKQKL